MTHSMKSLGHTVPKWPRQVGHPGIETTLLLVQGVPTNALHAKGYVSIGCEPCTRAVLPNQHEREGRWWWEVRL